MATHSKTFSATVYAIGVTSERLIMQPVGRTLEAKGEPITIAPKDVRKSSIDGMGGGLAEFLKADPGDIRIETADQKFKLAALGGGMDQIFTGDAQRDGKQALIEFLYTARNSSALRCRQPARMTFWQITSMTTPLDGIRVLDLTRVLAGPHCTRMLADLGADVIKVEPPAGDLTRFASPRINGLASYFVQQNAGKRNISLDLSKPGATEILLDLAEHCDVLVENFRPGVMARLGLGVRRGGGAQPADRLRVDHRVRRNRAVGRPPRVRAGRRRRDRGSRSRKVTPVADRTPTIPTAMPTSTRRSRRAARSSPRCSIASVRVAASGSTSRWPQTMLYVNEHAHDELWDGPLDEDADPQLPSGRLHRGDASRQVRPSSSAAIPPSAARSSCSPGALDRTDLIDDPRFVDARSRLSQLRRAPRRDPGDGRHDRRCTASSSVSSPSTDWRSGVLRSVRDVCDTEWAAERGVVVEVSDRGGGTIRVPNAPWRFSDAPDVALRGEPRYRGEDNRAVLSELLGLDDAELDRLEVDGVLSSRLPKA